MVETILTRSLESTLCLARDCSTLGGLVGDSVFTAYYRLGIGVNNAIDATHNMGIFLQRLARSNGNPVENRRLVKEKQRYDGYRMQRIYGHQIKVMWLEAFCANHVFLEKKNTLSGRERNGAKYTTPVDPASLFCVRRAKGDFQVKIPMSVALRECENNLGIPSPWKYHVASDSCG